MVKQNLPRNQRSLVSRFLCGILPLQVETGRFSDVKKELRFCKVCEGVAVEDEAHFLLKCKKLKQERKTHVKPILKTNPDYKNMSDHEKMAMLISPENMKEFGRVLAIMFDKRQELMSKKTVKT